MKKRPNRAPDRPAHLNVFSGPVRGLPLGADGFPSTQSSLVALFAAFMLPFGCLKVAAGREREVEEAEDEVCFV